MALPHKILLMSGSMDAGGSERQTLYLLQHLDRGRFEPHLVLMYRRGPLLAQIPSDVPVTAFWDSVTPGRFAIPGSIHRRQVRFLRDYVRRENVDLVYDRTFHMSMIAGPALRGEPCRRVSTIVCPPDEDLPHSETRFLSFKRRLLARSYREADRVLTVSQAVAESAAEYYRLPIERFETLYSPIDLNSLDDSVDQATEFVIDPVDINIACVGRLSSEKGQRHLIEAAHALRDHDAFDSIHIWFVGDGPDRESLQSMVEERGLGEHFHFTGRLPSAAAVMASCQLVVVPSLYEGLPNVVLESMALGIPVIATDAGGTPELLDGGRFGALVASSSGQAIADQIARFVEEPEDALGKAQRAGEHVRSQHSIEHVLPKVEAVFQDVLQRS